MALILLPLQLHHPLLLLPHHFHRFQTSNPLYLLHQTFPRRRNNHCVRAQSSSSKTDDDEEANKWVREEQRWLREEQRWIREEKRWNTERETLLEEISALNHRIQTLETQNLEIENTLQFSGEVESHCSGEGQEMLLDLESVEVLVKDDFEKDVEEAKVVVVEEEKKKKPVMATLRKGSEGEEVRLLQVALQELGFYSGEEDMEYSSFSSGTERAVKTWQASVGVPEDGVMSQKHLETLFMKQGMLDGGKEINTDQEGDIVVSKKACENGGTDSCVSGASEAEHRVLKSNSLTEVDPYQNRVFLLGENRWEEPSRLVGRDKLISGKKTVMATMDCATCLGEGRLLCTECDGTGEPNIEPQFLEWVDEGATCCYCEGNGYIICDVCTEENIITPENQNRLRSGRSHPLALDK